jgi:hypothetical protein
MTAMTQGQVCEWIENYLELWDKLQKKYGNVYLFSGIFRWSHNSFGKFIFLFNNFNSKGKRLGADHPGDLVGICLNIHASLLSLS